MPVRSTHVGPGPGPGPPYPTKVCSDQSLVELARTCIYRYTRCPSLAGLILT